MVSTRSTTTNHHDTGGVGSSGVVVKKNQQQRRSRYEQKQQRRCMLLKKKEQQQLQQKQQLPCHDEKNSRTTRSSCCKDSDTIIVAEKQQQRQQQRQQHKKKSATTKSCNDNETNLNNTNDDTTMTTTKTTTTTMETTTKMLLYQDVLKQYYNPSSSLNMIHINKKTKRNNNNIHEKKGQQQQEHLATTFIHSRKDDDDDDDNNNTTDTDDDVALAFFELANVPEVGYRILSLENTYRHQKDTKVIDNNHNKDNNNQQHTVTNKNETKILYFKQDTKTACGKHTGGIIWETSYLLLDYLQQLVQQQQGSSSSSSSARRKRSLGRVLELGSGCGLLGIGLAGTLLPLKQMKSILLTEMNPVLRNLQYNLQRNYDTIDLQKYYQEQNEIDLDMENDTCTIDVDHTPPPPGVSCCELDWTEATTMIDVDFIDDDDKTTASYDSFGWKTTPYFKPYSYDTILGTDVLFTPTLVHPLLETIQLSVHEQSIVYICVQIRCTVSHELFQNHAKDYDLCIENISDHVYDTYPKVAWGKQLDCIIFRLTHMKRNRT